MRRINSGPPIPNPQGMQIVFRPRKVLRTQALNVSLQSQGAVRITSLAAFRTDGAYRFRLSLEAGFRSIGQSLESIELTIRYLRQGGRVSYFAMQSSIEP